MVNKNSGKGYKIAKIMNLLTFEALFLTLERNTVFISFSFNKNNLPLKIYVYVWVCVYVCVDLQKCFQRIFFNLKNGTCKTNKFIRKNI